MLEDGVIKLVEELEWINHMVVQGKKQGGIRICVYLIKLNVCLIKTHPKKQVQLEKYHMNTNECGNKKKMVKGNNFIPKAERNETELTRIKHKVVEIGWSEYNSIKCNGCSRGFQKWSIYLTMVNTLVKGGNNKD